jgi:hypothetical protein
MDDRRRRIGKHAAESSLPWAIAALGPPPDDPAARQVWQNKAAAIGAYREITGHDHPDDPIGPEPATGNPDLRAAWHDAQAALNPGDTFDARHLTYGLNRSAGSPAEANRTPQPHRDRLRQTRTAARDANTAALRTRAEADAVRDRGDHDQAARLETLAASYRAMRDTYCEREIELDTAMRDHRGTEGEGLRRLHTAEIADHELRRPGPGKPMPSLPAEGQAEPGHAPTQDHDKVTGLAETANKVDKAAAPSRSLVPKLTEHHTSAAPTGDPVYDSSPVRRRLAILQPPKLEIPPSSWVLEQVADRDVDREAAD